MRGAVFRVKILSHVATAALIHLRWSSEEQLKALLRQLAVFEVGTLDIPLRSAAASQSQHCGLEVNVQSGVPA